MSALASVIAPLSYAPAIELAGGLWKKRVLPTGSINYQGRQLRFTPEYIRGLEKAFRNRAYDYVPLQLADSANVHTNDPERFRGTVVDMLAEDDGLYVLVEPTERGEHILRENPNLGVSCRIVEQYSRADGQHFPAAVQHILATHDPRITSLGPWQSVDMANGGGMIIDLSGSSFPGDQPPAYADDLDALLDGLSETEQLDALVAFEEAAAEADAEGWQDDGDELSDAELDALVAEAEADAGPDDDFTAAAGEFDAALGRSWATAQARQAADLEDLTRPLRTDEDVLARSLSRLSAGTHRAQEFSNPAAAAIELSAQRITGTCGPPDPVTGTCAARYHALTCSSGSGSSDGHVQLANSGAYSDALDGLALSLSSSGDLGDDAALIPGRTLELAHHLNESWSLHGDVPACPQAPAPGWDDLLSQPRRGDAYSDLAREIGRDDLAAPQPGYTGLPPAGELAKALNLR